MVVCAVIYEPVSLLLANIRVISEKNSERITKSPRSARRPLVFHFLGKFENREKQGASIGVNREISLPIQVRKAEILFAAGCPLSMSVFEVRADKCAVHALVSVWVETRPTVCARIKAGAGECPGK